MRGNLLLGTLVSLIPGRGRDMAGIGFDWLFLDAEHSPLHIRDLQALMQGAGSSTPCLVRVASPTEVPIKQALDVGASGIIAPLVNSADLAEQVVRFAKYAPRGVRGLGIGRAHRYGLSFQEYVDSANDRIAVIVQAEHIRAVENIEAIAAIEDIDAVVVGPYDLSASLDRLGQVDHPDVVQAIQHVTSVCQAAGKRLGIFGISPEAVQPYMDQGFTLITVGVDTLMLGQAAAQILARLRPTC